MASSLASSTATPPVSPSVTAPGAPAPQTPQSPLTPLFSLAPGLRLVLASASPRRRLFLEEWGLPFAVARPVQAEPRPQAREDPTTYAQRAATAKARAVAATLTPTNEALLILAADTVVTLDGDILGKPRHSQEALEMLHRLSGRSHEVISAVCLISVQPQNQGQNQGQEQGQSILSESVFSEASRVQFHPWPDAVLRAYVATHEPDDKAGAYAVQGQGAFLVARIDGSWSTVVGLPVTELACRLLDAGHLRPVPAPL